MPKVKAAACTHLCRALLPAHMIIIPLLPPQVLSLKQAANHVGWRPAAEGDDIDFQIRNAARMLVVSSLVAYPYDAEDLYQVLNEALMLQFGLDYGYGAEGHDVRMKEVVDECLTKLHG